MITDIEAKVQYDDNELQHYEEMVDAICADCEDAAEDLIAQIAQAKREHDAYLERLIHFCHTGQ